MSSALKPVLPPPGVPATTSSPGKAPTQPLSHQNPITYGQTFSHVNQNLPAMSHPNGGAPAANVNINMHNAPHIPQINIPQHHAAVNNVANPNVQNVSPNPTYSPPICPNKPLNLPPQNIQQPLHHKPQANGTQEIATEPPAPVENKVDIPTPSQQQPLVSEPSKIPGAEISAKVPKTDEAVAIPEKTPEAEIPVSTTQNDAVPTNTPAPIEAPKAPEPVPVNEPSPSPSVPPTPIFTAKSALPAPPKAKSTLKLATTPRTPTRKIKAPKMEESNAAVNSLKDGKTEKSPGGTLKTSPSSGGKSKRSRTRTQPYQSPLPELALISKLSAATTPKIKNIDEKLIVFYKNEFLAVRNLDGGFYICQAVQNVYKSSAKIRIRWLSQDSAQAATGDNSKSGDIYTPDFYDNTDFDCILTNLNLNRIQKGKYQLPGHEKLRTDNILKRALAVEKGETPPADVSLTEEHPDGLDLSLYRDESQLKSRKRKSAPSAASATPKDSGESPKKKSKSSASKAKKSSAAAAAASASKPSNKQKAKAKKLKSSSSGAAAAAKAATSNPTTAAATPTKEEKKAASGGRAERAKRRGDDASPQETSPVVSKKKAKVLAKVVRRSAVPASQVQEKKSSSQARGVSKTTTKSPPVASTTSRSTKPTAAPKQPASAPPAVAGRKSRKANKK